MVPLNAAKPAPELSGNGLQSVKRLGAFDASIHTDNARKTQYFFDRATVENHVRLLHQCAADCTGVIVLTPIWEGRPPSPQRFAIGAIAAMVDAAMSFQGVPGVNLYAQYGPMRRDLAPGKKGGEIDVEAVFAAVADIDTDKITQREIPVEPSYSIESSPGNFQHVYIFPRPLPISEAKPALWALHAAVGGDSAQRDCSHVWRIPGTLNWPTKSKLERGRSARISSPWQGLFVDPAELLALKPPPVRRIIMPGFAGNTVAGACDERRLRSALSVIPSDDRDIWLRVGMACHSEGFRGIWDEWSRTSNKFDPVVQARTWNAFRPGAA